MRLHVNPSSPFCRAVAVYFEEKAVSVETVELTSGADRSRMLELSPYGEVPVLETPHGVVTGSQSICDLLDHAFPEPELVPREPIARLACRRLADITCSTTDALQFLVHLVSFRRPELVDSWPGLPERLDEEVHRHYEFLEAMLSQGPFFAGSYSRADIFCFMMVSSLVLMGRRAPQESTALGAWFDRMTARPAVARNMKHAARSAAAQADSADPFFRADRIHWRSHRVEWACRIGLAAWLACEIEEGRAFFTSPPRREDVRRLTSDRDSSQVF